MSPASGIGTGAGAGTGAEQGPAALEPVPVAGCDICGALAGQREAARTEGRTDTVHRCNEELRSHLRTKAARR